MGRMQFKAHPYAVRLDQSRPIEPERPDRDAATCCAAQDLSGIGIPAEVVVPVVRTRAEKRYYSLGCWTMICANWARTLRAILVLGYSSGSSTCRPAAR